ncbi:MAG: prolipoprotein diacylglyceryl transferase, partial [Firmicutes bacterium]|nr:prolipoprotein diacylglyceryl transferase [Bacillota bacterium]
MNNVAFSIFGVAIYWYGLLIMAGLILGIIISVNLAKTRGYNSDFILDFVILAVPLGIIGARLFYVAFSFEEFAGRLDTIFSLRMSGLSIFGAVIGGIVAALIFARWKKISIWDLFDCAAPSLILAQALGRWGNFFNGEVYGGIVNNPGMKISEYLALYPPAVFIKADGNWHLALFLIESVWNLITFAVLMTVFHKQKKGRGTVF